MEAAELHSCNDDLMTTDLDYDEARLDPSRIEFYTTNLEDQKTFKAAAERLHLSFADLAVFCKHGFKYEQIPVHGGDRWNLLLYLKRAEVPPAKWMMISGLYPDALFSEDERRKRLRALQPGFGVVGEAGFCPGGGGRVSG